MIDKIDRASSGLACGLLMVMATLWKIAGSDADGTNSQVEITER